MRRTTDALARDTILTHGWFVQLVGVGRCGDPDAEPAYAYTVGLTRFHDHPEVIVFGACLDCANRALSAVGEAVRAGRDVTALDVLDELFGAGVARMTEVADSSPHLHIANGMYRTAGGPPIEALRLTLDPGHCPFPQLRPRQHAVVGAHV